MSNGQVLLVERNDEKYFGRSGEEKKEPVNPRCFTAEETIKEAAYSLQELNHRVEQFRNSSLWRNNPEVRKKVLAFTDSLPSPSTIGKRNSGKENSLIREIDCDEGSAYNFTADSGTVNLSPCTADHPSVKERSGINGLTADNFTLELAVQIIHDLLLDTQRKCEKMVNGNQTTSTRFRDELGECKTRVDTLRTDLAYAQRCVNDLEESTMITGSATESDMEMRNPEHQMEAEIYSLREENLRLRTQYGALQREFLAQRQAPVDFNSNPRPPSFSTNASIHCTQRDNAQTGIDGNEQDNEHNSVNSLLHASMENNNQTGNCNKENELDPTTVPAPAPDLQLELIHAKEALMALKHDRKRLKAEKVELLNQMKEVYQTLEAKERELRDFIRQFEQKMRESDKGIKELIWEKEKIERERQQLADTLNKANEKAEQCKVELEKERMENSKLHGQLKELQSRFLLLTGQQLQVASNSSDPVKKSAPANSKPSAAVEFKGDDHVVLEKAYAAHDQKNQNGDQTNHNRDQRNQKHDQNLMRLESTADQSGHAIKGTELKGTEFKGTELRGTEFKGTESRGIEFRGTQFKDTFTAEESAVLRRRQKPLDSIKTEKRQSQLPSQDCSTGETSTTYYEDTGAAISGTQTTQQHLAVLRRARSSSRQGQASHIGEASPSGQDRPFSGTGAGNRLSRLFHFGSGGFGRSKSKDEQRKNNNNDAGVIDRSASEFAVDAIAADLNLVEKADQLIQARQLPMARWRQSHLLSWLELELGMCMHAQKFMENVKSGKVLLTLTDHEIEHVLGITAPLHRKKLRLAIEEYRAPALCKFPSIKEVTNQYVCRQWLPSLGLSQYTPSFRQHLVDGRLLNCLNKKQLDKYLGVSRRFHQLSILKGIELLRYFQFDIKTLSKRRVECERENVDLLVWTNPRLGKWCEQIDLGEYADNLRESGIHGGLCVLDPSFTIGTLATALGIPSGRQMVRKHLAAEFLPLLNQARTQLENDYHHRKSIGHRTGGSLGRSFARSYTISGDQDFESATPPVDSSRGPSVKRRRGLRGSIGRVFGLRVRRSTATSALTNEESTLDNEVSPVRSSTVTANLNIGEINDGRKAVPSSNDNDRHIPANTSSPKPLNHSTGTLSSTTSDLGSSIERSQHMKTILGTPKVLTQPPLTSMISSKSNIQGVMNMSLSDTNGFNRLQHLCLSPGEVLLHGGSTGNSRNPLVRLRNKTRPGCGDVPKMGLLASVDVGSNRHVKPARPHSVGDLGGLSNYYNSPSGTVVGIQQLNGPVEKKSSSRPGRNSEVPTDVSFSPRRLQSWLSVDHFASTCTENGQTVNGAEQPSVQNEPENDENRATDLFKHQQYCMGTITEQGEPMESESESHSNRSQCRRSNDSSRGKDRRVHCRSHSSSSSASLSPCHKDRPKSLLIRTQERDQPLAKSITRKQSIPPLASLDSVHETDL